LDNLTLDGNLPLDIIEVVEVAKVFENKKKDVVLEIDTAKSIRISQQGLQHDKFLKVVFIVVTQERIILFCYRNLGFWRMKIVFHYLQDLREPMQAKQM